MLMIGLTGNIGSGKSTVAELLAEHGAKVIDADALAREATADAAVLDEIAAAFGAHLVTGGSLDRAALAGIVFSDEARRQQLNGIIHPYVRRRAAELAAGYRKAGAQVVVQDIPLLYEGNLQDGFDSVIVVTAPPETRLERVRQRSGLTAEEFFRRDASQLPLEQKAAMADFVIDNSGGPAELRDRTEKTWRELMLLLPPG